MKQKDIITLVVAAVIIGVSGYFIYKMLFPSKTSTQNVQTKAESTLITVPASIDEKTFTTVSTLSDYGKPDSSGVGKADLFSDF